MLFLWCFFGIFGRTVSLLLLWYPLNEKINLSEGQYLTLNDFILFSFFNTFSDVDIKESAIFTPHINYGNCLGCNFYFGMARGNLGIFDDDGGFFRDSSDDVLALKKRDFIFESGMVFKNDVCDDGSLILHSAYLRGNIKIYRVNLNLTLLEFS